MALSLRRLTPKHTARCLYCTGRGLPMIRLAKAKYVCLYCDPITREAADAADMTIYFPYGYDGPVKFLRKRA